MIRPALESIVIHVLLLVLIALVFVTPQENRTVRPEGILISTSILQASPSTAKSETTTGAVQEIKSEALTEAVQEKTQPVLKPVPAPKPKPLPKPEPLQPEPVTKPAEQITEQQPEIIETYTEPVEEIASPSNSTAAGDIPGTDNSDTVGSGHNNNNGGVAAGASAYIDANFNMILSAIRQNLKYPMVARKNGWTGSVELAFDVDMYGRASNIRILKSCGYAVLDQQAINAVKKSAPFPKPPLEATLVVPILFELK